MRRSILLGILFCLSCGIVLLACDHHSPSESFDLTSQASGTWQFSGQIVNNNCRFFFTEYQPGTPGTEILNVFRGETWRASHLDGSIYQQGMVLWGHGTPASLWFRTENPQETHYMNCSYRLQGEIDIFLDTETEGTGSIVLESLTHEPECRSCALLYTGTWTKVSDTAFPVFHPTPTPTKTPIPTTPRTPEPTPTPTETPIPTATPTGTPTATPTATPIPLGTLLLSAAPGTITDITPDATSTLTACALSPNNVPQAGVQITLMITGGSGLLSSGTLVNTVTTGASGCATDLFTEQGVSMATMLAMSPTYRSRTATITIIP